MFTEIGRKNILPYELVLAWEEGANSMVENTHLLESKIENNQLFKKNVRVRDEKPLHWESLSPDLDKYFIRGKNALLNYEIVCKLQLPSLP